MWQNRLDQSDQPVQPTFFGRCTLGGFNPPTGFDPAPHNPLRKQGGGGLDCRLLICCNFSLIFSGFYFLKYFLCQPSNPSIIFFNFLLLLVGQPINMPHGRLVFSTHLSNQTGLIATPFLSN